MEAYSWTGREQRNSAREGRGSNNGRVALHLLNLPVIPEAMKSYGATSSRKLWLGLRSRARCQFHEGPNRSVLIRSAVQPEAVSNSAIMFDDTMSGPRRCAARPARRCTMDPSRRARGLPMRRDTAGRSVARWAELWTRFGDGQKLDRVESVRPVHRDRRNEQNRCQRNANHGDPRANENGQAADEFESDCHPRHRMRRRNPEPVKRRGQVCRTTYDLRIAVRDESPTDNQS